MSPFDKAPNIESTIACIPTSASECPSSFLLKGIFIPRSYMNFPFISLWTSKPLPTFYTELLGFDSIIFFIIS